MPNLRIKTFLTAVGSGCNVDVLVELWSVGKTALLASKVLEDAGGVIEDYPAWYNLVSGTGYVISVTNLSPNDTQAHYDLNDGGSITGAIVQEGVTFDYAFVASGNNIHLDGFAIISNCSPVGITSQVNTTTGRLELLKAGSVVGNIPNTATIDGWSNIYYTTSAVFSVNRTEGDCISGLKRTFFTFSNYTGVVKYASSEDNFDNWSTAIAPTFQLNLVPGVAHHLKFRDDANPSFVVDVQFTPSACTGSIPATPIPNDEFVYTNAPLIIAKESGAGLVIKRNNTIVSTITGSGATTHSYTPTAAGNYTIVATNANGSSAESITVVVANLNTSLSSGIIDYMVRQNCVEKNGMKGCRFEFVPAVLGTSLANYNFSYTPDATKTNTKIIREAANKWFIQIENGTTGGINVTISNSNDSHTHNAWSNSCDHSGCPTCCEDNQRSVSVVANGATLNATWSGVLAAWQKLNWYNTNIPQSTNQTVTNYSGAIIDPNQPVIFQAQPTQVDTNGTCYYHGWTRYIYRQHLSTSNFCSEINKLAWVSSVLLNKTCNNDNTTNQPVAVSFAGTRPSGLNVEFGIGLNWAAGTWNQALNRFEFTFQNVPNSSTPVSVAYRIQGCTTQVSGQFTTCPVQVVGTKAYTVTVTEKCTASPKVGWSQTNDVSTVSNFVTLAATQTEIDFLNVPTGTVYFFAVDTVTNATLITKNVTS